MFGTAQNTSLLPPSADTATPSVDPDALSSAVVTWQASLFGSGEPSVDPAFPGLARRWLDDDCWVDHVPRWLDGSDHVFAELVARLPWRQRVVRMYERVLDEPRLTWWWDESSPERVPVPVLHDALALLGDRYGVTFDSIGCNFYRDGRDSVAWHGDTVRHSLAEPIVAIVSVGAPRPFLLRPRGGGPSLPYLLGQGDLLVMGGACQHHWEHTVPKVAAAGPRISVTYRHQLPAPPTPVHERVVDGLAASRAAHPSARRPGR